MYPVADHIRGQAGEFFGLEVLGELTHGQNRVGSRFLTLLVAGRVLALVDGSTVLTAQFTRPSQGDVGIISDGEFVLLAVHPITQRSRGSASRG